MRVRNRKWSRYAAGQALRQAALFALDPLEGRRLLSASLDDGLLSVGGTPGNDDISVGASGGSLTVTVNGQNQGTFAISDVDGIQVSGLDGNDSISLAGVAVAATLSGGNGN